MDNTHKHLRYEDIERFATANEDSFNFESLGFFTDAAKSIHNCSVCRKRLHVFRLVERVTGTTEEAQELFGQVADWIKKTGGVIWDTITIEPAQQFAFRGDGGGASDIDLCLCENYFTIDLDEPTELYFEVPEIKGGGEYQLALLCEDGSELLFPLTKTESGEYFADVKVSGAGRYAGTVVPL